MHASDEDLDLELDFPSKDPGQMRTFSPVSRVKIQIQIIDISRSGLKVRTPQLVFRGTIVQVRVREAIILGEVRYCVAAGTEFDAGIQIQDVVPTRSSRANDVPGHVLRLEGHPSVPAPSVQPVRVAVT